MATRCSWRAPRRWLRPYARISRELERYVVPSVGADEAELVRSLLADAGAAVAYVT